jgi:hypothetical protein
MQLSARRIEYAVGAAILVVAVAISPIGIRLGSTLATGASIFDRSDLFATSDEPYFFDVAHINEAGNRFAAERLAEIVTPGIGARGSDSASNPLTGHGQPFSR